MLRSADRVEEGQREHPAIGWYEPLAVLVVALVVGSIVRGPYWEADFAYDDRGIQYEMGMLLTGRTDLPEYLLVSYGEHLNPLWKLSYYALWRWQGLRPEAWHHFANVWQAVSSAALFLVLVRYLRLRSAAWVGSLAWAGVALGNWDDPLLWITAGNWVAAVACTLLAMACVAYADSGPRWGVGVMAAAIVAATLFWSTSLALTLVVGLQIGLWARTSPGAARVRLWLLAWLVPWLALAIAVAVVVSGQLGRVERQRGFAPRAVVSHVPAQFAVALANQVRWKELQPGTADLPAKFALAGVVAAAAWLVGRRQRTLLLLFFALPLPFLVLVNVGRANFSLTEVLESARYQYIATLPWCTAAAVLAAAWRPSPRLWARGARGAVLAALLVTLWMHQARVASAAAQRMANVWEIDNRQWHACGELLDQLALLAEADGQNVRLADIPLNLHHFESMYFPVSAYAAVCRPGPSPGVEFVPPDEVSDRDLQHAQRMLARSTLPLAGCWRQLTEMVVDDARHLIWLSEQAQRAEVSLHIRNGTLDYGPPSPDIRRLIGHAFSRPPAGLSIGPVDTPGQEVPAELLAKLAADDAPAAEIWLDYLAGARDAPVSAQRAIERVLYRADVLADSGDLRSAVLFVREAVAHHPDAHRLRLAAADFESRIHHYEAATAHLQYVAEHAGDPAEEAAALTLLAELRMAEGRYDEARAFLHTALERVPEFPRAELRLGVIELFNQNREAARPHLLRAADGLGEDAEAQQYAGIASLQADDLAHAKRRFARLATLAPWRPEAHFYLAVIAYRQHYWDEAHVHLSEALRWRPGYVEALDLARHLEEATGRKVGAAPLP